MNQYGELMMILVYEKFAAINVVKQDDLKVKEPKIRKKD
jgi:hypothetical protein